MPTREQLLQMGGTVTKSAQAPAPVGVQPTQTEQPTQPIQQPTQQPQKMTREQLMQMGGQVTKPVAQPVQPPNPPKSLVEPAKQESAMKFLPQALGETALEMGKDIVKPFTRTAGTLAAGATALVKPEAAPQEGEWGKKTGGMLEPYSTPTEALKGVGEIGLTLAPETKEAKVLLESANAYLKGRTMMGLGKPVEEASAETAGKILQPKTAGMAEKGAEGLKYVKTKGVKTYAQLKQAGKDAITKMSEAVDKRMAADVTPRMPSGLPQKDAAFIKAALRDMGEVYSKSRSPEDLARVSGLNSKFETQGLTTKEINDVAKEYNTTFRNKAFKKNGEAATSWMGEGYENTRRAVKEAARNLLPDETTRNLDEAVSKVYAVEQHASDMADAVMKAKNKRIPANIAQKIGKAVGKTIHFVSSNIGLDDLLRQAMPSLFRVNESASSIELEAQLAKNLSKVRKLSGLNGKDLANELIRLATESAAEEKASAASRLALPEGNIRLGGKPDVSGVAPMSTEQTRSIAAGKYRPPNVPALPEPNWIEGQPYKGERATYGEAERMSGIKSSEKSKSVRLQKEALKKQPIPYR